MTSKMITCTECPNGCQVQIVVNEGKIERVSGYMCLRGKKYAENEFVDPRRVLTSTVKTTDGRLVPVKTAAPIRKTNLFAAMEKVNRLTVVAPVRIGQVLLENIDEDISLIATGNCL